MRRMHSTHALQPADADAASTAPWRALGTGRDVLGECPLWDEQLQCLWWIDIRAPTLRCLHPASGEVRNWPMGALVGAIALTDDPHRLLIAVGSRLALFDWVRGSWQGLADAGFGDPELRFNDGRVDSAGRFWVGSMHNVSRAPVGRLFRFAIGEGLVEVAGGVCIPNSLAFSPDGRTMYFADSLNGRIDACNYDPGTAARSPSRPFAHTQLPAFPDGSCIDETGALWNAEFHASRVMRHRPDGHADRAIELPVKRPTACAFGGPDLRTLYITTTSQRMTSAELEAEPLAGSLLALEPGVRGLSESRFRL